MSDTKKKNLLVTLADANFTQQAKQLFSSVYFNAGWEGDYLLLAHDISDTDQEWFRNKGILIYNCPQLINTLAGMKGHPAVVLSKFYLFKEYFKQWDKIIFLDADIIVRGSLDDMLKIEYFGAVSSLRLWAQFFHNDYMDVKKLEKRFNLLGRSFNSGVFIFDSNLIKQDTFSKIMSLYSEFRDINFYADEGAFNLFFYKKWKKLPIIYNSFPDYMNWFYKLNKTNMRSIIIHFVNSPLPWNKKSPYYEEWTTNLIKAEAINLDTRLKAVKVFSVKELSRYFRKLKLNNIIRCPYIYFELINYLIGRVGLFIKHKNPNLYKFISLKKDER